MKNSLTFLMALLFVCSITNLSAQTELSGTITSDLTLTGYETYLVTGNIFVNPGVTFTIPSGVTLLFNGYYEIEVRGTMNATNATFTANGSTTPGFWEGFYVSYEWSDDVGTINLDGCDIEYAHSIWVRNGSLTLSNGTTLTGFSSRGLDIYEKGTVNVSNTTITNGNDVPVYFRGDGQWNAGAGNDFTGNLNDNCHLDFYTIDVDLTYSNIGIPYYVNYHDLTINEGASLTLEDGVEFLVRYGKINVNGFLKVLGTESNPVSFDKHPDGNRWYGINYNDVSEDAECVMNYASLSGCNDASIDYSAVELINSSPTFNNVTFTGNHNNIKITGRSLPIFNNCTLGASESAGHYSHNINVDWNAEPSFIDCSIGFNDEEARAIGVIGNSVTTTSTVRPISFNEVDSLTYLLTGDVTVEAGANLTIESGLVIKTNSYWTDIIVQGAMTGIGTEAKPIVFTYINNDDYGNPGDTYNDGEVTFYKSSGGRVLLSGQEVSVLDHWIFDYAGNGSGDYAVNVGNNNILKNSTIRNCHRGLLFHGSAQILNNYFENIEYYAASRYINSGTPYLVGNTTKNAGYRGIRISDFGTADTSTMGSLNFDGITNIPYVIDNGLTIPENKLVTIEPGVVIKSEYWGRLYVNGGLVANGTEDSKIIFTSFSDDSAIGDTNNDGANSSPGAGNWAGISFRGNSMANKNSLKNCEIRYARGYSDISDNDHGAVRLINTDVSIDSCQFTFINNAALAIYGQANPVISNTNFYNISYAPIYMDPFSNPTFEGNRVANVNAIGIALHPVDKPGTFISRDFAGYTNINYIIDRDWILNEHIIVPEGLVFKTSSSGTEWKVYGRLDILGTEEKPVVFTSWRNDDYGTPADMQQDGIRTGSDHGLTIRYYDASDDSSRIEHAIFSKFYDDPIECNYASPTIKNVTFENSDKCGILLVGISKPVVKDCVFDNIAFPIRTSLVTFTGEASGNVISGTTGRGIMARSETLNQDALLAKRDFAGITNIPYVFDDYTVGTAALLTIEPGVVCKFIEYSYFNIQKGIQAIGGSTPDSAIVFTSVVDDFYGGDTYHDGDLTTGYNSYWRGIYFAPESLDDESMLKNCIIKHASRNYSYDYRGAITMDNASPTITNCLFTEDRWGIITSNISLPTIENCDFINIEEKAIWNRTVENLVTAENCYWNHNTGPYNETLNPDGLGEQVSDGVDFDPWAVEIAKPEMGDVSLNGTIKPYDASLVLQSSVGNIVLSDAQQVVADVTGDGAISPYDASFILQYTVGLITKFEVSGKSAMIYDTDLEVDNEVVPTSTIFEIPIHLYSGSSIKSMDFGVDFDYGKMKFIGLTNSDLASEIMLAVSDDQESGSIKLALASANELQLKGESISLKFELSNTNAFVGNVTIHNLRTNETLLPDSWTVIVNTSSMVGVQKVKEPNSMISYMEDQKLNVLVNLKEPQKNLNVRIHNYSGQLLYSRNFTNIENGVQELSINISDEIPGLEAGIYFVTVKGDGILNAQQLLVK